MKKRSGFVKIKRQNTPSEARRTELVQHSTQKRGPGSKIIKTAIISSRASNKQFTGNDGTQTLRSSRRSTGRKIGETTSKTPPPADIVDSSLQKNGANLKNQKSARNSRAVFELPKEAPQFTSPNPEKPRIAKKSIRQSRTSPDQVKRQSRIISTEVNALKQETQQKQEPEVLSQRSNRRSKVLDECIKESLLQEPVENSEPKNDYRIETIKDELSNSEKPIKRPAKGTSKQKAKQSNAIFNDLEQNKDLKGQKPQTTIFAETKPSQQPDQDSIDEEIIQQIVDKKPHQKIVKTKQIIKKKQIVSKSLVYKSAAPSKSHRKKKVQSSNISGQEGWDEQPKRKQTQQAPNHPRKRQSKKKACSDENISNEISGDNSPAEPNLSSQSESKSANDEHIYHSSSSEDLAALLNKFDRKPQLVAKPLEQVDVLNDNNMAAESEKESQPAPKNGRTKQNKELKSRKRKRSQPHSDSDHYGQEERSFSEPSSPITRRKTAPKSQRTNVKTPFDQNDDSDLGQKPAKKLKKQVKPPKEAKKFVEKFDSASDGEDEENFDIQKEDSKKQVATNLQGSSISKSAGSKRGSRLSKDLPKSTVFTSLKDRLAALQSEIKRAERQDAITSRVEPILTTGPMGLAQSRISQLINSTVSDPQKPNKSVISQILENLKDPLSRQIEKHPTSLFPDRNNSLNNADHFREKISSKPKAPLKSGGMDLQYENQIFLDQLDSDKGASKRGLQSRPLEYYSDEGNESLQKLAKKQDFNADNKLGKREQNREIYQSNVSKFVNGPDKRADRFGDRGNETSEARNRMNQLISKFSKHVEVDTFQGPSNRLITSRVAPVGNLSQSGAFREPIALSNSRIDEIIRQRRQIIDPAASLPDLPGLLTRAPNPLGASSVQSTLNMSRPRVSFTPPMPGSRVTDSQGSKALQKKYTKLCDLLTSEGYEVMIEESTKNIAAFYPDLLVAVSSKMKDNFKMFGDVLSFQILGQSYQHCRLGVFTVFNSNRRPLLAGYAVIFSSNFNSYHRIIQFFLHIHYAEPESILTSYSPEMIEAVAYLQRENIFTGAHVLNAKDIITILEKEIYGTVAFNDRTSKTEPFFRFITEKSKEKADIFEKEIAKLSSTVSGSSLNKRAVNSILNEKSKICYSWLPNKFIGIGMQQSKEYYNTINNCYRCYQSNSHEFLIKQLILIDKQMPSEDTKLVFYADPVQIIFQDDRLKDVRLSLDSVVFKTFLKNYTEACCFMTIINDKEIRKGTLETKDRRTNETTKVTEWVCECLDESKTGVGCQHMLAGAKVIMDFDYLNLVRKRWKNAGIQTKVSSTEADKFSAAKDSIEVKKTENALTKMKVEALGVVVDFEEMEYYSDEETDLPTIAAKRRVK